jgi:hypothetical protein
MEYTMLTKKLGWIALGGFAVGFVALGAAYIIGRGSLWANIPGWIVDFAAYDRCDGDNLGETTERRWAWSGANRVNIAVPGDIHYRVGEGDEVIVRGSIRLLDHIIVEDDSIALKCGASRRGHHLDITLPGKAFREINLAGSGNLVGENLDQEKLELNIAGSGSMRATGSVGTVEVSIAGSGNAKLGEVTMERLELNVAGSGDAEAAPAASAEVNIVGSGNLRLLTRPKNLETTIIGSGRVIHAAPETGI